MKPEEQYTDDEAKFVLFMIFEIFLIILGFIAGFLVGFFL